MSRAKEYAKKCAEVSALQMRWKYDDNFEMEVDRDERLEVRVLNRHVIFDPAEALLLGITLITWFSEDGEHSVLLRTMKKDFQDFLELVEQNEVTPEATEKLRRKWGL